MNKKEKKSFFSYFCASQNTTFMHKILFICHGNICRSPMAEFVMKKLVKDAGREAEFEIASAATSTEEIGNPVYPPAKRKLAEHNIGCAGKTARQITQKDYEYYDYIIAMDHNNLRNLHRMLGLATCPHTSGSFKSTLTVYLLHYMLFVNNLS